MSIRLRFAVFVVTLLSLATAASAQTRHDFAAIPEPDHVMLFKLYLAANADVLDDDVTAVDYHYLFNVRPNSAECTSVYKKAHNDIARQELVAAARASSAKVRTEAAFWPKTALVPLRLDDRLGEYDSASGAFRLHTMPTNSPAGRMFTIMRTRDFAVPDIYPGPVREICPAGAALFRGALPALFRLELTGGTNVATLPMDRKSAESYLQRHVNKLVVVEVLAEIGPAVLRPNRGGFGHPVPARFVAARALDPIGGAVLHEYASATAQTSAAVSTPPVPSPGLPNTAPATTPASAQPKVSPPAPSSVSPVQSTATWKGDFAGVPEPTHRALFKLYLASNADVSDDDDTAWQYHVLFNVPPGKVPYAGSTGAPSEECMALMRKAANDITRQDLVRLARAEFKKTLAEAPSWPKTAFFRLRFRDTLEEYDAASGSFPLVVVPRISPTGPLTIPRMPGLPVPGIYLGVNEHLCEIPSGMTKGKVPAPHTFELGMTGAAQVNRVSMDKAAASAYLDSRRGAVQRNIDIELIVEVGPLTPRPNPHPKYQFGLYFLAPARVVAARALDPANGQVVQEMLVAPAGSPTTTAAAPPGAGSAAATKANPPAPKTSSPPASQIDLATAPPSPAGPEPLTRWRVGLLTLRHFPELADKVIVDLATRLIQEEQTIWSRLDLLKTTQRKDVNPNRPEFTYEWQKLIETQPEFARGAMLDLFMKPDADWSFVKKEREWDERFTAAVAGFLFARDKIEGRQPGFAARELAPVAKRHLELAVAAAPTNLWFPMKLASWDYDFGSQEIRFRTGELLETPRGWFDESYTVLPPSAAATANHAAIGTTGTLSEPKEARPGLPEPSGTEKWRYQLHMTALPNYGVLALDRLLFLKSIPMDPKTAERLALKRAELHAKVYITATRVELGESKIDGAPRKFAVLFATLQRIDVLTPENELVATVKPEALSLPKAATTPPPAPAPTKAPPEQTETLAERQADINKDVSNKTASIVGDLKKKSDAQLAQAAAASKAASEAAAQPPAQGQSAGAPAGPAWQPCGGDLKSGASQTAVPVEFVNTSKQPRKLIWFDFAGAKIVAGILQPGQRAPMQTYTTHAWMIADSSDQCMGTLVISKAGSIEIR